MAPVSRMTLEQLLMIDTDTVNDLDKQTLSNVLKQMSRYVQTRVKAFDKADEMSPALDQLRREGGQIMYDPSLTIHQMRREWARAVGFLSAKTSTLTGWRQHKRDTMTMIRERTGIRVTAKDYDQFWRLYQRMIETDPKYRTRDYRYEAFEMIAETIASTRKDDAGFEHIFDVLRKSIDAAYIQNQQADAAALSGMYELHNDSRQTVTGTKNTASRPKKPKIPTASTKVSDLNDTDGGIEIDIDV